MKVFAAILAAGKGTRFGSDKTQITLRGKPLWRWSYDVFSSHPRISGVGLMGSDDNLEALRTVPAAFVAKGKASRQETSAMACALVPEDCDAILIHDAARPFVSPALIDSVIDAIERCGAAAPALPVNDTLRRRSDHGLELVQRAGVVAMQTPQGARREILLRAHKKSSATATDEIGLIEQLGLRYELVPGDPANLKITHPDDLHLVRGMINSVESRTGLGYDIHPFSKDPKRRLTLGGVEFEGSPGLEGHSDADVLIHALVDALLGAAALGDIGQHFPNTDPTWKGEPSTTFLTHAVKLLAAAGWQVVNADVTMIAETPKVMAKALEIRTHLAQTMGVEIDRVSVKATTNEKLGALGRSEGIAAHAVATISRTL